MSFELWIQWFEQGDAATVAASDVRAIFSDSIVASDGSCWQLSHRGRRCCELYVSIKEKEQVSSVTLARPCPDVWDSVHQLVSLGHGVCYWPAGPPVIVVSETASHLASDMTDAIGPPQVATSGAAISIMITTT